MAEGISRGNAAELQHTREKCPTALFYWISGAWAGRTSHSTPHRGAQPHQTDTFNFFFFLKKGNSDRCEGSVVLFHEWY